MRALVISIIASVLILGFLGTAENAFAPKKLFVGGLSWNTETQEFDVELFIHHGFARAAQNADFVLVLTLDITDKNGNPLGSVDHTFGIPRDNGGHGTEYIQIGTGVQWDRNGSFEGIVNVEAIVGVEPFSEGQSKRMHEQTSMHSTTIYAHTEVCNNGIDDDGDGTVDCQDSDCLIDPVCVQEQP